MAHSDNMALLFPELFEKTSWKIWIVSGTSDSECSFSGTLRWMNCLERPVKNKWTNWYFNGNLGGSIMDWDRITYFSV